MKVFIKETIETLELDSLICENGTNWVTDFLGNNDSEIKYNSEDDRYECDEKYEFDWWQKAIEKQNKIQNLEKALKEKSEEEFEKYEYETFNLGLEDEQNARVSYLEEKI